MPVPSDNFPDMPSMSLLSKDFSHSVLPSDSVSTDTSRDMAISPSSHRPDHYLRQ
jgi:hypothetical protein